MTDHRNINNEGVSYQSLERPPGKKDYTKLVLLAGVVVLVFGIFITDVLMIIMGIMLIYIMLYKKTVIINEKGMTTHYNGVFYKKTTSYSFKEFDTLRIEESHGMEQRISFVRRGVSYHTLFKREDAEEIIDLALDVNPNIRVIYYKPRRRGMV